MAASSPSEYEKLPTGKAGEASQISWSRLDGGSRSAAGTGVSMAGLMTVRFVLVDLYGDRFGLMCVAMVVVVIAIRPVNMRRRGSWRGGFSRWVRMVMSMTVATCAVCSAFRLKGFVNCMDDQVHGPQHVG